MGDLWTTLITSTVVVGVLVISALFSWPPSQAPTGGDHPRRRCIGIFHPDLGTGLVFPTPGDDIVALAQEKLGISNSCPRLTDNNGLISETLMLFKTRNGKCVFHRLGKLAEAAGLLCGGRIDLNTAGESELVLLPGIGPSRARKIIEWRETNGPFSSFEDLGEVRGIGEKTAQRLRHWVEW